MKHFFAAHNSIKTAARALFVALFVALGLSSCDNVSGGSSVVFIPPVIQPANPATPATAAPVANEQRATVTFCGSIGVGNALPQEVSAKVSALSASLGAVAGVSKAAQPDLEIGKEAEYYYYVSATPQDSVGNDPVEYGRNDNGEGGKFSNGSNGITYALPLNVGQWIIECGIKNSQNKPVLKASSGLITLDESQSVVSRTFSAAPVSVSDAGNGSVLLTFNKGTADVDSAIARWKDSSGTEQSKTLERVMEGDPAAWTGVLTLDLPSVAPGAYEMTISFYNNSDPSAANRTMVFQTVQTVSVFSGMKTNKWVTNGYTTDKETGLITDDGCFIISSAAVNVFRSSFLYVGDTGSTAPGYRGPSDSNEGSFLAPFATLQKAFNTIEAAGSGEVDYTIYVCGSDAKPVKGNAVLSELLGDPSNKKAKSILITNVDGSTHAVIAGGGADEALNVISVLTDVPVKIRGVKITRDPANTTSRGININKAGASVTLLSGTEICGHASGTGYAGAGVHVEAGSLRIKGAKITDNHSQKNAGGVYVSNVGSATMESGEISSNSAPYGGGVSVESNNGSKGSFEMTGGTISGNTATSADGGGAVYVNGEFKISGNASIPYGGSVKSNDVALKDQNQQVIVDGSFYSSGKVATITPTVKTRGTPVLKKGSGEINADDCGRFGISSLGFSIKKSKQAGHLDFGVLSAPIYVSEGAGAQDSPNEEGTQTHPFKTLQYAVSMLSGGEPDTIFIDGTLEAKQTIPNTFIADNCSALTIMGAGNLEDGQIKDKKNPVDAIAIPSTGSVGSALEIQTSVPITIMNLKITGGNATASVPNAYGGGIYLNSGGDVTLSDAALVTKNNALVGGGVYVCSGAKLYLNGSAVIGDNGNLPAAATGSTAGANKSGDGAGIYNSGSVFLGYERGSDGNPKEAQLTGGVIGNYAEATSPKGAGISNSNMGVLKIASGKVSYNGVNVTGNADGKQGGGGVYNNGTVEMTGGEIVGNEVSGTRCYGGGVLITKQLNMSGTPNFTMTGGTISGNKAVGDNGYGGAVCEDVWSADISFTMGGTASIPYGGTVKNNDVYLVSSNTTAATITIASAGFAENAPNTVATITLAKWKRKTNFLISTSSNVITDDHTKRFNFTSDNDGWERVIKSTNQKSAYIDSPIYVVDATDSGNTRPEGFNKGNDSGATGTKTNPYATIAAALGCDDLTIAGRTITVAGTLGAQTIASDTSVSGGTSSPVTITGYRPVEGQPSPAQINGGGSATALSMAKSGLSTTIQYLTITGGKAENGGGINISDGTVTLSNFANVVGNSATSNGGGVYVTSGATLKISDYSEISGNMAASGATISGGGVYNEGTVTMTGGTISSNTAATGGAIYNKNSLTLNGAVSIPAGTGAGANDIALFYDTSLTTPALKPVTVTSGFSTSSAILLTPTGYKRGKTAVSGATATQAGNFTLSDSEWSVLTDTGYIGKIDAPIYVAQADACTIGEVSYGGGKSPADGGLGTKAAPYDTIANAVSQCWNGPNDKTTTGSGANAVTVGRVINVVGTLEGSQTIGSGITTSDHASAFTIKGVDSNAKFHAKGSSSPIFIGKPLSIESAVPVALQNLTLMNGYHTTKNGGGIYVKAAGAKLTLGENVHVKNNILVTSGGSLGGGVYIEGTEGNPATLIMKSNADISNNKAKQYNSGSNTKGGGVYLKYANLCMSGTALIGMTNQTEPSSSGSTNYAIYGGGVYADTDSTVWLGYSEPDDSKKSDLTDGYGIRWNFGFKGGGGIYNNGGTVKMASGGVLYNATSNKASDDTESDLYSGGGVYNGGTLSLTGGTINGNKSDQGGGVYNNGSGAKIYMTGTALIGGSANGDATDTTGNFAAREGGGVYNNGGYIYLGYTSSNSNGTPASTSATELANGIRQNYAYYKQNLFVSTNLALGGGIYSSEGKIYYNTGNISYNGAGNGGGIYLDYSTSGASLVMTGGTMASNKAGTSGGAVFVMSNGTGSAAATIKSSFSLSGSATSIASTGNTNNDIYLYYDSSVTVAGSLATDFATRINNQGAKDGDVVLSPQSSSATDVSYVTDNFKKFAHNTKYIQSNGALFSNQSAQNITTTTSSGTFGACSLADLSFVADKVYNGNTLQNVTIKLADNVTIDNTYTKQIGYSAKPFKGTLDGNSKTVTYASNAYRSIVGYAGSGATIKNLTLSSASAVSFSPLAETIEGATVDNCVNNCDVAFTSGTGSFGGMIGLATASNRVSTTAPSRDCVISNCRNYGNVSNSTSNGDVGGIVGSTYICKIINCAQYGNVEGYKWVGGIVGRPSYYCPTDNKGSLIENCCVTGNVTARNVTAHGIIGVVTSGTSCVFNCLVTGTISATSNLGGIGNADRDCAYYLDPSGTLPVAGGMSSTTGLITSLGSDTINKLNAPASNMTTASQALTDVTKYKTWQLVSGKPQLVFP